MAEIKLSEISDKDIPNNSNRAKRGEVTQHEAQKPKPQVVSAKVIPHKDSLIKDYVFDEVILPNIKTSIDSIAMTLISGIADSLTGIVKTCLFGETPGRTDPLSRYTAYRNQTKYSHPRLYEPSNQIRVRPAGRPEGNPRRIDNILFDSRQELEDCLVNANDIIEEYGRISVAKFYDICGITTTITQYDYGWYDLVNVRVRPSQGKWILELPPTIVFE